jgi:hypothetical protein
VIQAQRSDRVVVSRRLRQQFLRSQSSFYKVMSTLWLDKSWIDFRIIQHSTVVVQK